MNSSLSFYGNLRKSTVTVVFFLFQAELDSERVLTEKQDAHFKMPALNIEINDGLSNFSRYIQASELRA